MRIRPISEPRELGAAWSGQYARLAELFSRVLPKKRGVLVEIGCGKGQLTIPLAERLPRCQIIGLDRFRGSYSQVQTELLSNLASLGKNLAIKVIVSDYKAWLSNQQNSKYDAIISSEFLPEIDSKSMRSFFLESYRVLKVGGTTIHSFLSPKPRNARQRLLIEADSDPRWTKTPPTEWFSPPPRQVLECLKLAGFKRPRNIRLRSGLVISSSAARKLLKDWDVRQSYWKSHREALEKVGLEIPDWLIVGAAKISS